MNLVNRTQLKAFILSEIQRLRPGMRLTRVSKGVLDTYQGMLINRIRRDIQAHPSVGQTFKEIVKPEL